jgi:chemotaxis protein CheX
MPPGSAIAVQQEDVEQIVETVFSTMTGIELEKTGVPCTVPAGLMTAAVYLAGGWEGAVLVHCFPQQACDFASSFLGLPPSPAVTDNVRDVLGELANMIAGNLKCILCPGIKLSVPSVVDGDGCSLRVCRGHTIFQSRFGTAKGPFWLTVIQGPEIP